MIQQHEIDHSFQSFPLNIVQLMLSMFELVSKVSETFLEIRNEKKYAHLIQDANLILIN
jgi:hypothetical protein